MILSNVFIKEKTNSVSVSIQLPRQNAKYKIYDITKSEKLFYLTSFLFQGIRIFFYSYPSKLIRATLHVHCFLSFISTFLFFFNNSISVLSILFFSYIAKMLPFRSAERFIHTSLSFRQIKIWQIKSLDAENSLHRVKDSFFLMGISILYVFFYLTFLTICLTIVNFKSKVGYIEVS